MNRLPTYLRIVGPPAQTGAPSIKLDFMNFRFSGHETFACRYAWLPKAVQRVKQDPQILMLGREDQAMVKLGVGKNMVRAIRFWAEATGTIEPSGGGHAPTHFGRRIFLGDENCKDHTKHGLDPFLEDVQTLWLLHWKLGSNVEQPIYAWDFILSKFHEPELTASSVFEAIKKDTRLLKREVSDSSIHQQFEIFLHSYVPTRGRKGDVREDNLDCPLVELGLLEQIGHRPSRSNQERLEPAYAFRRESKPEISAALFAYCVDDFWCSRHADEKTLSFQLLAAGHGSPGQIFKLPEDDLRRRVESLALDTGGHFEFRESASVSALTRSKSERCIDLDGIYEPTAVYAES